MNVKEPLQDSQECTQTQRQTDEKYMRRCLQLAVNGLQNAKPNPMVGAVIVSEDGRIIGEGYHVHCGHGHAEVNAFAAVKAADEPLLPRSTVYVSLEPCSHWGKTPPCADLIVSKGVRRVVCGCVDPFSKVRGRGIQRMREAGIEVTVGVLEKECLALNANFVVFNTHHRPHILLKWAQTANGMIGGSNKQPLQLSTPFTWMLVHKLRAEHDAILVGRGTYESDRPQLTVREWAGHISERMILGTNIEDFDEGFSTFEQIDDALRYLYEHKLQSLMVEGGCTTLQSFIDRDLWDEIHIEIAPFTVAEGTPAPSLPHGVRLVDSQLIDGNMVCTYRRDNAE